MDTIADALLHVFYAATIAALGFFIHKVLWLVQYKRLQGAIVGEAVRRLRDGNAAEPRRVGGVRRARWTTALGRPRSAARPRSSAASRRGSRRCAAICARAAARSPSSFAGGARGWAGRAAEPVRDRALAAAAHAASGAQSATT